MGEFVGNQDTLGPHCYLLYVLLFLCFACAYIILLILTQSGYVLNIVGMIFGKGINLIAKTCVLRFNTAKLIKIICVYPY